MEEIAPDSYLRYQLTKDIQTYVLNLLVETFLIENRHVIRVDDISTQGTMVEISRVPFELNNEKLSQLLQRYGDVEKCQSYYRIYGNYTKCTISGHRIAWIDLKTHIPQTLHINQINNFINIKYPNQSFTCNNCGKLGHGARGCNVKPKDF